MKLKDACSLEGRGEAKTNLYHVLKSSDITLPTKVCIVKAATFPVVVYRCEIWTIKKAEGWKIDAFELWCWDEDAFQLTVRKQPPAVVLGTEPHRLGPFPFSRQALPGWESLESGTRRG